MKRENRPWRVTLYIREVCDVWADSRARALERASLSDDIMHEIDRKTCRPLPVPTVEASDET